MCAYCGYTTTDVFEMYGHSCRRGVSATSLAQTIAQNFGSRDLNLLLQNLYGSTSAAQYAAYANIIQNKMALENQAQQVQEAKRLETIQLESALELFGEELAAVMENTDQWAKQAGFTVERWYTVMFSDKVIQALSLLDSIVAAQKDAESFRKDVPRVVDEQISTKRASQVQDHTVDCTPRCLLTTSGIIESDSPNITNES